jgi:hypothetical protein
MKYADVPFTAVQFLIESALVLFFLITIVVGRKETLLPAGSSCPPYYNLHAIF